jgi:hypothetical protein
VATGRQRAATAGATGQTLLAAHNGRSLRAWPLLALIVKEHWPFVLFRTFEFHVFSSGRDLVGMTIRIGPTLMA